MIFDNLKWPPAALRTKWGRPPGQPVQVQETEAKQGIRAIPVGRSSDVDSPPYQRASKAFTKHVLGLIPDLVLFIPVIY